MNFNYFISRYERTGEEKLLDKRTIENPNLNELKEILGVEANDEICGMYPIDNEKSSYFYNKFGFEFDLEEFEYFFEVTL